MTPRPTTVAIYILLASCNSVFVLTLCIYQLFTLVGGVLRFEHPSPLFLYVIRLGRRSTVAASLCFPIDDQQFAL